MNTCKIINRIALIEHLKDRGQNGPPGGFTSHPNHSTQQHSPSGRPEGLVCPFKACSSTATWPSDKAVGFSTDLTAAVLVGKIAKAIGCRVNKHLWRPVLASNTQKHHPHHRAFACCSPSQAFISEPLTGPLSRPRTWHCCLAWYWWIVSHSSLFPSELLSQLGLVMHRSSHPIRGRCHSLSSSAFTKIHLQQLWLVWPLSAEDITQMISWGYIHKELASYRTQNFSISALQKIQNN